MAIDEQQNDLTDKILKIIMVEFNGTWKKENEFFVFTLADKTFTNTIIENNESFTWQGNFEYNETTIKFIPTISPVGDFTPWIKYYQFLDNNTLTLGDNNSFSNNSDDVFIKQ